MKRASLQQASLARLRKLLDPAGRRGATPRESLSSGCDALDELLPLGGWRPGSLVEWLSDGPGGGASTLALVAARQAAGVVVAIDRTGTFYPPAAAAWRLELTRLLVVHPQNDRDEQWALDQALRCEHVAAVLGWPRRLEERAFRRLQLAAEASGALGLLVRPAAAQREPSWADVRLAVSPRASPGGWQLGVRLLRCRGHFGKRLGEVVVEIDERTGAIHAASACPLAPQLARAAPRQQQA